MDSTRARNLSCYGYSRKTTPNIDKLSKEAIFCKNAISTSNWTLPSIASFFTGLYPFQHRILNEFHKLSDSDKHKTLAEILKSKGYETVSFSSNGWISKYFGFDKGFEHFYEIDKYTFPKNKILRYIEYFKAALSLRDYGGETINKAVISYFSKRKNPNKPIFLFIHYVGPHHPYNPKRPFHRKFSKIYPWDIITINKQIYNNLYPNYYKGVWKPPESQLEKIRDLYDGEIAYLDYIIHQLIENLQNFIDIDKTIIVITADHGECLGESRELKIIGHQIGLYDDLIRVPLIFKHPEIGRTVIQTQIQLTDIYHSIVDILNGRHPLIIRKDEISDNSNYAFAEYYPPPHLLRKMEGVDKKYIDPRICVRTNDYKLIYAQSCKEFYDLTNDPLETKNIYSNNRIVSSLEKELRRFSGHEKMKIREVVRSLGL